MRRALALLLLAAAAFGQSRVLPLDCPPQLDYRIVRDLDGDGRDEFLIVNAAEVWLWKGRRGDLPRAPDARMRLPEGAALFDLGHVGGAAQEVVVRTAGAYWALAPGSEPRRLDRRSGPGLPERAKHLLWRGFFHDLDLDGRMDFVDVSTEGYRIDFGTGDTVLLPAQVSEEIGTLGGEASGRFTARYAFGAWEKGNFDGDLRPDFAVMTRTGLRVHPGDARGRFDADRSFAIDFPEAESADLTFADFNRDGRTDVLAVARKAGEATLLVASPAKGLAYPRRVRLKLPGELRYPVVTDFNQDGRLDLALPYLPKVKVEDAVRIVLRNEVLIKVPLFLNHGGDRCFRAVADNSMTLPVRVRMDTDSAGRLQLSGLIVVEYEGDLDGDGRRDLVVTRRPDLLGIHPGIPTGVFHEDVGARVPIPDASDYEQIKTVAADLNGDGRSDIILHYRGAGRRPDRLYLLTASRKK